VSLLPTSEPRLRRLIDGAALVADLPGCWTLSGSDVLEGLILTESSGDPRALRYEPAHDRAGRLDQRADADVPGHDDGLMEDDKSYGLMQVMGENVRRMCHLADGTAMGFEWVLDPIANLYFGTRLLKAEVATVQRILGRAKPDDEIVQRALARYNGGPTGDRPDSRIGGDIRLRAYVERVRVRALLAHNDRVSRNWEV
jgi:Transglycosylase SLT domain